MIKPGEKLQDRYRVERQIGQGGMGAVYVAADERLNTTVAIKETLCMDENFRKAIEREARLLSSLDHPTLPRVSDHFEENDSQFLVMEYVEGDDVASILERDGRPFAVDNVLEWADDLLDALDYLHGQSLPVVHRDIKPQNLKITPGGKIMLLDFGLAKGSPTDASHKTAAKSIFGYSRNYASLEQIQGTGTDPRSDLYSLAATLYHLLTGVPPEDALTRAMAMLSNRPDPLIPANVMHAEVPAGLAGVLHATMDLTADKRPASAAELRQMLRNSEAIEFSALNSDISSGAQIFAQPTQLMPAGTRAGTLPFADVRSSAAAAGTNTSQITQSTASRGGAMAAGAGIVLAALVVFAAGVFVVRPELFGIGSEPRSELPARTVSVPAAENRSPSNESSLISNSATDNIEPPAAKKDAPPAKPQDKQTAAKAKTAGPAANTSSSDPSAPANAAVPDIPPGGMIITRREADGKVTTLKVDPGARPQRPPAPPAGDWFPQDFDMTKLTTEQQRRIFEMKRRPRPRPTPAPEASPQMEYKFEFKMEPAFNSDH
jgi:serine/threonine protein kinase